jgi:AcrR family transcriptional regulator
VNLLGHLYTWKRPWQARFKTELCVRAGLPVARIDDTRAQLLAAARGLFLESGPAHFSLRESARHVRVSAPAVYRHFDDKGALLFAACTQGFGFRATWCARSVTTGRLARMAA